MATQEVIPVAFEDKYPDGAYVSGEVKPARDFDLSSRDKFVQAEAEALDPQTGEVVRLPVWWVTLHDGNPEATETVRVSVVARHQPVLPPATVGPFRPVVLDGMAIEPFVNRDKCKVWEGRPHRCGAKVAYKVWARGISPAESAAKPAARATAGNGRGGEG